MQVYYNAHESWQIHWQPPAVPEALPGTPAATITPTLTSTPTSTGPIFLEVQGLAEQFEAPFQQGPGWVHVVTEIVTNPQAGQNYPPPYLSILLPGIRALVMLNIIVYPLIC
jgi:hypothetical protein